MDAPGPIVPSAGVDQDSLDNALVQTLITAGAVGALLIIVFLFLRKFSPRIYAPNLWTESLEGKQLVGIGKWLPPVLTINDEYIYRNLGLDAVVYDSFSRAMLTVLAFFCAYGFLILWPVDGTASNKNLPPSDPRYVNGTAILTMSDINTTPSSPDFPRFTAHLISVVFNSVVCYIMFFWTYIAYSRFVVRQRQEPVYSNYTVLVDNISPNVSEEDVKEVYEGLFPGEVLAVHRVVATSKLHDLYRERLDYYTAKDNAQYDFEHDKDHERPQMRDVDCLEPIECVCCWKRKVDTYERADRKLTEFNAQMDKAEKILENTTVAFVTFNSRTAAVKGSQTIISRKGVLWHPSLAPDALDIRWSSFEYHPWSRNIRYWISLIAAAFVGVIFFIPVTFAQGLANLATLSKIPVFDFIVPLIETNKTLTQFIEGILPAIILSVAFIIAKLICRLLTRFEHLYTRSHEDRSYTSKLYYILVLNVFLASIAAGTIISLWNSATALIKDPTAIVKLLAMKIPSQVNFFINYIAVNCVIGNLLPLLQIGRFIVSFVYKHCCHSKNRMMRAFLKTAPAPEYPDEYVTQLLFFTIIISYSSLAPLITPFGLIYFLTKYFTSRYLALYVWKKRHEGFGKAWPSIFNRLCAAMVLYQALMTGIFSLNQFEAGIVVCAILAIFTLLFALFTHQWFYKDTTRRAVEIDLEYSSNEHIPNEKLLSTIYRDPLRDWKILTFTEPLDHVHFTTRDYLRQLQLYIEYSPQEEQNSKPTKHAMATADEMEVEMEDISSNGQKSDSEPEEAPNQKKKKTTLNDSSYEEASSE